MAPSYNDVTPLTVPTNAISASNPNAMNATISTSFSEKLTMYMSQVSKMIVRETKKETQKRVAEERMLASWKTYNDKSPTVKEIKQICKPQHKLNHSGRRF